MLLCLLGSSLQVVVKDTTTAKRQSSSKFCRQIKMCLVLIDKKIKIYIFPKTMLNSFFSCIVFLFLSTTLYSQTILPISNLSGRDTLPFIKDHYVVWQHDDGDEEIYLYNTSNNTKIAVTSNSTADILPHLGWADLNNSGNYILLLTWLHWDGVDYEVAYCTVDAPATINYITNDVVDQGQSFISNLGIVWSQKIASVDHVFVYYNATTRDASSELGGPGIDNCSTCGLQMNNGTPFWYVAYTIGKRYPNELIRNGTVFSLSYGYCVDNTTSFAQYETRGAGAMVQIKEDIVGNNSEVVATVYANSLNTCENISQNNVADYDVCANGLGGGFTHIAYFTKTGLEENVVVYKKDFYTSSSVGVRVLVTNTDAPKKNLVAMQNCVAWLQYDGQDWDVYLYDGSTTQNITNNSTDEDQLKMEYLSQGVPALVWKGQAEAFSEIYYCDPSSQLGVATKSAALHFDLYPNPVTEEEFNFQTSDLTNKGVLILIDSQGKEVWTKPVLESKGSYSIGNVSNGVYLVKFQNAETVAYRKLIVQNK